MRLYICKYTSHSSLVTVNDFLLPGRFPYRNPGLVHLFTFILTQIEQFPNNRNQIFITLTLFILFFAYLSSCRSYNGKHITISLYLSSVISIYTNMDFIRCDLIPTRSRGLVCLELVYTLMSACIIIFLLQQVFLYT